MKKYILPLILILCLAFTLTGSSADLFGTYDQRIKLTIDNTKIDATLTHFPVMAQFGQMQAPNTINKNCRRPGMRAIYDSTADKTFIVFTGIGTHPYITYYDHTNKTFGDAVKVGVSPSENQHNYPMLLIDSSGYLYVFYGASQTTLRYAKSDNVRDISAWTDTALTNATFAGYPFPVEDDGGDIYVFYRRHQTGVDADYHRPLYFVKTADGGDNWSAATVCIENTDAGAEGLEEVYIGKIAHESAHDAIPDKVHLIWTMAGGTEHDESHEDIYYAYFNFANDKMYAADDTDLGACIDDTELESNCKVVDTGAADEPFDTPYVNFVSYKTDGTPIIVYGDVPNNGWYYNEYDSGWGTPVKLVDYSGYTVRGLIYDDPTIKVLIFDTSTTKEYTSTDGSNFSNTTLFTSAIGSSEYVANYQSLIRIITHGYLAGYTNDSPLYLYPGHNISIFDELTTDASFDKCTFTSGDEETQLYGDCELFNADLKRAIYHYSKTGWEVSSSADTDSYFYYDGDASNNTSYISMSGNTAAQSVYDGNFEAVYHMQDNTTSTILDSTSNNNDGTKKGIGEPVEAVGQVGQGQDFDGGDDYITFTHPAMTSITIESCVYLGTKGDSDYPRIIDCPGYVFYCTPDGTNDFFTMYDIRATTLGLWNSDANTVELTTQYHLATAYDNTSVDNNAVLYINGTSVTSNEVSTPEGASISPEGTAYIGNNAGGTRSLDGILDELRISNSIRNAAWIKATYNSLWDTLLTYGAEETPVGITWNGIVITKWNGITVTKINGK